MTADQVVAIIDNDQGVLKAIGRLLRAHGLRPEGFATVETFLARSGEEPACLVLDLARGDTSGFDLLHRLKSDGRRLPVIVITPMDDECTRRRAFAAGCVAFLRKPFAAAPLLAAIEDATPAARKP
jgi:FixJ family two-component response regulator